MKWVILILMLSITGCTVHRYDGPPPVVVHRTGAIVHERPGIVHRTIQIVHGQQPVTTIYRRPVRAWPGTCVNLDRLNCRRPARPRRVYR